LISMIGHRRAVVRVALLTALTAAVLWLPSTAGATPPATPALTTWGASAAVKAQVVIGNTLYFGGSFTSVVSPDGLTTVARRHLAAVDLSTGELLAWAPATNGSVDALATDGTSIFVGGGYTTLGGVSRSRLGAVDAAGTVLPWATAANDRVLALHVRGSTLFVGGSFTTLGGEPRARVGALTTAGELTAWAADVSDRVKAITTTAIGDVVIAGYFDYVNGETEDHIARLDATTGASLSWGSGSSQEVVGVVTGSDDNLYAAIAGSGGKVRSWTSDGHHRWTTYADGDVNAVAFYGGQVIAGGHWIYLNDGLTYLPRLAALDPATGVVDLSWTPKPNKQIWSFGTDETTLAIGGVFTKISRGTHRRIAVYRTSV
jgi:hypothetical protein